MSWLKHFALAEALNAPQRTREALPPAVCSERSQTAAVAAAVQRLAAAAAAGRHSAAAATRHLRPAGQRLTGRGHCRMHRCAARPPASPWSLWTASGRRAPTTRSGSGRLSGPRYFDSTASSDPLQTISSAISHMGCLWPAIVTVPQKITVPPRPRLTAHILLAGC